MSAIPSASALLAQLRRRGVRLWVDGPHLVWEAPLDELTGEDLAAMQAAKPALLAAVAAESDTEAAVRWRVEAMLPQVPPRGPIPFLLALTVPPAAAGCMSCGDAVAEGTLRCWLCARAAQQALGYVREDVPLTPQQEGDQWTR